MIIKFIKLELRNLYVDLFYKEKQNKIRVLLSGLNHIVLINGKSLSRKEKLCEGLYLI